MEFVVRSLSRGARLRVVVDVVGRRWRLRLLRHWMMGAQRVWVYCVLLETDTCDWQTAIVLLKCSMMCGLMRRWLQDGDLRVRTGKPKLRNAM